MSLPDQASVTPCPGVKIRYADAAPAELERERLHNEELVHGTGRPGQVLHIYFCQECSAHHIGHHRGRINNKPTSQVLC